MSLTLNLSPEALARLNELAGIAGKTPESIAVDALQEILAIGSASQATPSPSARLAELRNWLSTMPGGNPNADISRESIYGNRGE